MFGSMMRRYIVESSSVKYSEYHKLVQSGTRLSGALSGIGCAHYFVHGALYTPLRLLEVLERSYRHPQVGNWTCTNTIQSCL